MSWTWIGSAPDQRSVRTRVAGGARVGGGAAGRPRRLEPVDRQQLGERRRGGRGASRRSRPGRPTAAREHRAEQRVVRAAEQQRVDLGATAGAGTRTRPPPSRSPRSGASSSATAASISGPDTIPASTIGTKRGVACSYTSTAGFSSLIALKYAWERTVAGRRDHADAPVAGREGRGGRAGPDDAQHRQVVAGPQVAQRDGGRGVARDHERLDVAGRELVQRLDREPPDLLVRADAVRRARVVAEVDRGLVR